MKILILLILAGSIGAATWFVYMKMKKEVIKEEEKEKYIPTTQDNIPIDYVRDGIVKMKNGSYVAIVAVPSINIDLMEGEEREAVLMQYRQILNAIDFPFQFLQQSRVVDITDYLKKIDEVRDESSNIFVEKQLTFYSSFLVDLIKTRSVLTKKFYIAVAYDAQIEKMKNAKNKTGMFEFETKKNIDIEKNQNDVLEEEKEFNNARKELRVRSGNIVSLFSRLGIKPQDLHDDEIVELFYTSYNKTRSVYQGLPKNINENSTTLYVKRK